jgi:hypothetical protein
MGNMVNSISDQCCDSALVLVWIRIRIQDFVDQTFTAEKNSYFLIKTCYLFIPRHQCKPSKLQEQLPALKRERRGLQIMKFFSFFLFLWVIFALLDLDPHPHSQWDRSTKIMRIRIHNTVSDPADQ